MLLLSRHGKRKENARLGRGEHKSTEPRLNGNGNVVCVAQIGDTQNSVINRLPDVVVGCFLYQTDTAAINYLGSPK